MIIPEYWCFNYDDCLEYLLKMKDILFKRNKVGVRYTTHKLIVYELPGDDPQFEGSNIWELTYDMVLGLQLIRPVSGLYKYTPYITEEMISKIKDNQQLS